VLRLRYVLFKRLKVGTKRSNRNATRSLRLKDALDEVLSRRTVVLAHHYKRHGIGRVPRGP